MATSDRTYGGHSYKFVDGDLPDEYLCHICTLVARDPQQVTCCYNIYCKSCLDTLKEKGQGFVCPTCRSSLEGKYFKDGRAERGIKSLKVHCTNTDSGCQWMGTIKDIDTHLNNSCTYQLVPCTNGCGKKIRRSTLKTHLTKICPKRIAQCQYCKRKGRYQLITSSSHLDECPDLPIQCSNEGCNEKIPRHSLASHNETCPKAIIPCEYNIVGCNKKMKREEQEIHKTNSMEQHMEMAIKRIDDVQPLCLTNQVMKLNEYKRRKEENEIWYSPDFYTKPGGYKMSLSVYPNGNEEGKGTHVSLYINLMKGKYDNSLNQPFIGAVTVQLLNQVEDKKHKKCIMQFDDLLLDERAREGKSIHVGRKKFISHEKLEEIRYNTFIRCRYLIDDCLYFKVSVKDPYEPWLGATNTM